MTPGAGPVRPDPAVGQPGPGGRRRLGGWIRPLAGALCLGWLAGGCGDSGPSAPAPATPQPAPAPAPEPAPPPAPNCGGIEVEMTHEGVRREEYESLGASFMIRGPSPETAVDVVWPYRDGGRYPPPSWAFVEAFDIRRVEAGIERSLTVEWIGALELDIRAPDCPPLRVACDAADCILNP